MLFRRVQLLLLETHFTGKIFAADVRTKVSFFFPLAGSCDKEPMGRRNQIADS
jgi:hypothetical protein